MSKSAEKRRKKVVSTSSIFEKFSAFSVTHAEKISGGGGYYFYYFFYIFGNT
jgi:hypothetical protein